MRIKNLYCPWDVDFFGPQMAKKYKMELIKNSIQFRRIKTEPVVVFGCYGIATKRDIMNHEGLVVIVWSGSDSVRLHEDKSFIEYVTQNTERVFHIAHSHWIQTDLRYWGIEYIDRVIFPVDLSGYKFEPEVGNSVYHYGSKQREFYYGTHLLKKLRTKWNKRAGMPNIVITALNAYNKEELYDIYKDCYVGVRLTEHDNMALSCVEMGLMGRFSIFNGNIPCALHYPCPPYEKYAPQLRREWIFQDESLINDISYMIHQAPKEPSELLADEMQEFIYDDEIWLYTEHYD